MKQSPFLKFLTFTVFATLAILYNESLNAKVKLPSILGDNMVIQQNTKIKLWGKASENKTIKISTSWDNKLLKSKSNSNGEWIVEITTPTAGGPYKITFDDGEKTSIENIYAGEVWLCSGQSNMEMPIKGFPCQPVLHSNETIANANTETLIRMFSVQKEGSKTIKDDVNGSWGENTPMNVANFSATAYFFGQQLYKSLNVPIGLINTSWGGSKIEAWMSESILKFYPEISMEHLKSDKELTRPNQTANVLYNAMLAPIKNFKIKGAIWYQGEANRHNAKQYKKLFPDFVKDVRRLFNDSNLPFYYVQIAPFPYYFDKNNDATLLREAQLECEKLIDNSGMVVLTDIGDKNIIHPSRKKEVGERLAYLALNKDYDKKGIISESPRYKSKKIINNTIVLSFDRIGNGLTSFGKPLVNFEIAGEDKIFHPAKAVLKRNQVIVSSDKVTKPIAVRYAFKNYVVGNLFNTAGLPVSSFRTDF